MPARATSSKLKIEEKNGQFSIVRTWSKGRRWETAYRGLGPVETRDEAEVLLMAELLHEIEEDKRRLKEKKQRRAADKLAYRIGRRI